MSKPRPATPADGDVAYWKIEQKYVRIEVAPVMLETPTVVVSVVPPPNKRAEMRQTGMGIMLDAAQIEDLIEALRRALAASKQGDAS
jgi:hypothetical protein